MVNKWYCDKCGKDMKIKSKSSHNKSKTHNKNYLNSEMNANRVPITYKYDNQYYFEIDAIVEGDINECERNFFYGFNFRCEYEIECEEKYF